MYKIDIHFEKDMMKVCQTFVHLFEKMFTTNSVKHMFSKHFFSFTLYNLNENFMYVCNGKLNQNRFFLEIRECTAERRIRLYIAHRGGVI